VDNAIAVCEGRKTIIEYFMRTIVKPRRPSVIDSGRLAISRPFVVDMAMRVQSYL